MKYRILKISFDGESRYYPQWKFILWWNFKRYEYEEGMSFSYPEQFTSIADAKEFIDKEIENNKKRNPEVIKTVVWPEKMHDR